jgi:hypothetical protein
MSGMMTPIMSGMCLGCINLSDMPENVCNVLRVIISGLSTVEL